MDLRNHVEPQVTWDFRIQAGTILELLETVETPISLPKVELKMTLHGTLHVCFMLP